jgi:hypothetical protein
MPGPALDRCEGGRPETEGEEQVTRVRSATPTQRQHNGQDANAARPGPPLSAVGPCLFAN